MQKKSNKSNHTPIGSIFPVDCDVEEISGVNGLLQVWLRLQTVLNNSECSITLQRCHLHWHRFTNISKQNVSCE